MLDVACVEVTTETVVNYFEKAGISKEKQPGALLDTDDPFKDLQEQFDKIVVYNTKFFPEGTTANDKVSVDDSLTSTEPLRPQMAQMMFLINQIVYNLVTCVKLWIYFDNTCYLVKMESLLTNI